MTGNRLFVALPIPTGTTEELRRVRNRIRQGLEPDGRGPYRWVLPDSIHLTLAFLGETPEDRTEDMARAMSRASWETGPLLLVPTGIGAFPSPSRPRVLWVGLGGPGRDGLVALQQRLANELTPLGYTPPSRPFHPHLTLARVGGRASTKRLSAVLDNGDRIRLTRRTWDRVVLYRSTLNPAGARYDRVHESVLG